MTNKERRDLLRGFLKGEGSDADWCGLVLESVGSLEFLNDRYNMTDHRLGRALIDVGNYFKTAKAAGAQPDELAEKLLLVIHQLSKHVSENILQLGLEDESQGALRKHVAQYLNAIVSMGGYCIQCGGDNNFLSIPGVIADRGHLPVSPTFEDVIEVAKPCNICGAYPDLGSARDAVRYAAEGRAGLPVSAGVTNLRPFGSTFEKNETVRLLIDHIEERYPGGLATYCDMQIERGNMDRFS